MKKKALILFLATMTATALLFTGCRNKETETTPVVEETTEEIEATETEVIEPVEEILDETNQQIDSDIKVDEELVEETVLTQEEIDELKATAPPYFGQLAVEHYETIINNGSWTSGYGNIYTKVVGKPDASWRRMTDEEVEAILAEGESAEGYYAARAEVQDREFYILDAVNQTIWFDYYAWIEQGNKGIPDTFEKLDEEIGQVEIAEPGEYDNLFN